MAIDAQVCTSEAHDLYEQLNLTKWHDKHTNQRQQPGVTHLNVTLADYHKHHAPNQSCLLHLRIEGTQPYKLPKLNADIRTGKYDTTPREAIHLLPYQTFDLIIPLPDGALVPHVSTEPMRVTVIGHITPTSTPQQATNRPATTQESKSTPTQARQEATRQASSPPPKSHLTFQHSQYCKAPRRRPSHREPKQKGTSNQLKNSSRPQSTSKSTSSKISSPATVHCLKPNQPVHYKT